MLQGAAASECDCLREISVHCTLQYLQRLSSGLQCQFCMTWCLELANQIHCCHSLFSSYHFLLTLIFWSLHKIIMVMDLVTFTWGLAGKCWCKKHSESLSCFSIGSLSPPTVLSRGLTSWWCLKKTGFHLGSNASWALMKRFLGLFLCTYRVKPEHVSKHCSVELQHLLLSAADRGLFIPAAIST